MVMTTTTALTIRLPVLPDRNLSLNAYLANGDHWIRAKRRAAQVEEWMWELKRAGIHLAPPVTTYPVAVTVTVRGTGRRTDPSNWVCHYGIKVLLDCLTQPKGRKSYGLSLLVDDSAKYISSFNVRWGPNGEPETEVQIESIGREVQQ